MWSEPEPPDPATEKMAGYCAAQAASLVSGTVAREPDRQHPAESRVLLGQWVGAGAKSLHPQTRWRCRQSGANSSLRRIP